MRHGPDRHLEEAGLDDGVAAVEVGAGQLAELLEHREPGIGDQHVEAAEALDRGIDQGARGRRILEVAEPDRDLGPPFAQARRDLLAAATVRARMEHDARTRAGQPAGEGRTDAAARAGDENRSVGHFPGPLAARGGGGRARMPSASQPASEFRWLCAAT